MSRLELTEREIERVLAGHQPPGRPDLAEVAFLFARLRTMGDFEQAPPMSPRLLAELDAADVQRRPTADTAVGRLVGLGVGGEARSERRDDRQPHRPAHARRTSARRSNAARRRWQLVGAAAVIVVLAGMGVLSMLGGGGQRERTEVASGSGAEADDQDVPSRTETTKLPTTTTPTTAPTTTAPPTTQPSTTTTMAPPPTEAPAPPPDQMPDSEPPWPGEGPGGFNWEEFDEWCEDHPQEEECEWWERYRRERDGVTSSQG